LKFSSLNFFFALTQPNDLGINRAFHKKMQEHVTAWHLENFCAKQKFSLVIWNGIFADVWAALVTEQNLQLESLENGGHNGCNVVRADSVSTGCRDGGVGNASAWLRVVTTVGDAAGMIRDPISVDAPQRAVVTPHLRRVADGRCIIRGTQWGHVLCLTGLTLGVRDLSHDPNPATCKCNFAPRLSKQ
jgi:hypothetical protein